MASRGTTPGGNKGRGSASPTKGRTIQNGGGESPSNANKGYARGLTEHGVEIEHLKTTIIALNEKVVVS